MKAAASTLLGARLTPSMLATLMAHVDGPRKTRASLREMRTLQALRDRRLIFFNRLTRHTRTTANGRGRKTIAAMQRMQIAASPPATVAVVLDPAQR